MRLHRRHLIGTAISSVPYLAIAIGLAVFGHSPRHFTAVDVIALVTFCVVIRLEYRVGAGSAVAGQLVFVPLLFLMPLNLIPLAVCIGSVIGTGVLALTGQKPTLCPNAFGTSWYTIPPVLLLMATGEKSFAWHSWPLYTFAVLVQSLADLVPAGIYERVVNNTDLRPLAGVLATVYGFDVLLTPVGMLAAAEGGFAFLALLPFTVVLWLLSRERENRLQAESLAHIDDLTGGANRRSFDERLGVEQARSSRSGGELSICMIDLDHFKTFNDTFGHPAGDDLLRRVTELWAAALRPEALLARLGGEEFGVILPEAGPDAAEVVVERLRGVTPREVTFSAGIATWDGDESLSDVVARADAALYRAKSDGRDRFVLTV
ncbi:MAG TPA: GGDEF domain-containing protein [Gaiellaceae bacterium]|nr:GGDEF domain-containing protein [Gaiellaceae bacterium]